jgi:hypothetical protein
MGQFELIDYGYVLKRKTNAEDTALNLAATAAQYSGYAVLQPVSVRRLMFFVTTATTFGLIAPKVAVTSRPTYGSTSNAVTIGTMTIATGLTAGNVVVKDISDNVRIPAGNELSLDINVQGTDSGTAQGAGWFGIIWELAPDADANQTKMSVGV